MKQYVGHFLCFHLYYSNKIYDFAYDEVWLSTAYELRLGFIPLFINCTLFGTNCNGGCIKITWKKSVISITLTVPRVFIRPDSD